MPKLSVIVPVYNVERYLPACIDSILSQSLSDLEVICINDGSPDRSGEILELYARLDGRVRVIPIDNQGVSHARNLGIEEARGTYLCFVDSDDLLMPGACETVVRAFEDNNVDVIKFSAEAFPPEFSNYWTNSTLSVGEGIYRGFSTGLIFDEHTRPFPWNGAYRTAFLRDNGLRFPEDLSLGEDQVFSFATLSRSRATQLISRRLYRYRLSRRDSLTSLASEDQVGRLLTHQRVVDAILDDWESLGLMEGEPGVRILDFVCSFLLFDIFELRSVSGRDVLLRSLRELLREHMTLDELRACAAGSGAGSWLERVFNYDGSPRRFGRGAVYGLTRSLYGKKAALRRVARDVRSVVRPRRAAFPGELDVDEGVDPEVTIKRLNQQVLARGGARS